MSRSYRLPYYKDGGHKDKQMASRACRSRWKQVTRVYLKHWKDHMYGYNWDPICIPLVPREWVRCECCYSVLSRVKEVYEWYMVDPPLEPEYPHRYSIVNPYDVRDWRYMVRKRCKRWVFPHPNDGMPYRMVIDNTEGYIRACRK